MESNNRNNFRARLSWYWGLLSYKVYANLAAEASKTYLSVAWWVLEPLFLIGVYTLVFSVFLPFGREDFIPNLIVGVSVWQWFNRSVINSTQSIKNATTVITRVPINSLIMPLSGILTDSLKAIGVICVIVVVLQFLSFPVNLAYLALPLVIVTQATFITALSFWAALLVPFVPDLRNLINLAMIGGMLSSGVFYTVHRLPPELRELFLLNPMASLIFDYRNILLHAQPPGLLRLAVILLASSLLIYFAVRFEARFRNSYTRLAMR